MIKTNDIKIKSMSQIENDVAFSNEHNKQKLDDSCRCCDIFLECISTCNESYYFLQ
jgi:hypothetical protein